VQRALASLLLVGSTWSLAAVAQAPALPDDEDTDEAAVVALPEITDTASASAELTPDAPESSVEDRLTKVEIELAQQSMAAPTPLAFTFRGYFDFGFFVPQGDGAGIVQDFGDQVLRRTRPGDAGKYAWVFLGDILSPAVNARGEAADLGPAPGVDRFDSIDSQGAMGAVLNEANFTVDVGVSSWARGSLSVNVVPRGGGEFSIGDFIELDLAQLELIVSDAMPTSVFAGKIEPVIGVEYKRRRADLRFGITPSLIARYTSGAQLGLKVRSKLFGGWVLLAAAVTNQSATQEQFHFSEELDSNDGKTASGRAALRIPLNELFPEVFSAALELAGDGLVGPQDRARDSDALFVLWGFDWEYDGVDFGLRGQFLRGNSPGRAADRAYGLDLIASGYVEVDYMITPFLGVMARADFRNAWVTLGLERAYLTQSWRATGGLRVVFNRHFVLKGEYLHNGEYGELPQIDNDIFTSSLVVSY
jgi:hypothetical protein